MQALSLVPLSWIRCFTGLGKIIRLAKPGNSWGPNETGAYSASLVKQEQQAFFGGPQVDVCVLDSDSKILLIVQEDESHINPQDPEAQLVSEAIAAFQANNRKKKAELFLDPLGEQVFPGITLLGTFPRFYKIRITAELNRRVRRGAYPTMRPTLYRHTSHVPGRRDDGTHPGML